jgi:hypothetical protein
MEKMITILVIMNDSKPEKENIRGENGWYKFDEGTLNTDR